MTFTQLLLAEIRRHIVSKATDPSVPSDHQALYYALARDIGRNTPQLVRAASEAKKWQDRLQSHEEATNAVR
jgi:hypothetical protein